MNNWTIIYTSDKNGNFLHEKYLYKYNPNAQIILADLKNVYNSNFAWTNCDLIFRDWLKSNIYQIKHNNVYVCEYDVLTRRSLPEIELSNTIYVSKIRQQDTLTNWMWWEPYRQSISKYTEFATAIIPFGWFMCSKNCLEIMLDHQYDHLYYESIISELRFGTLLRHALVKIEEYHCPNIKVVPNPIQTYTGFDFYHPVKQQIDGLD